MTREALKLALEALHGFIPYLPLNDEVQCGRYDKAITAIKEALAQPELEPVGKFAKFTDGIWREVTDGSAGVPLYTTPPQRTWVGLTELEKAEITSLKWWDWEDTFDIDGFIKAIEAKLKEKNT